MSTKISQLTSASTLGAADVAPVVQSGNTRKATLTQIKDFCCNLGTAVAGIFTTGVFSGTITPSQTLGIVGTTTNNNAQTGSFGEYIESIIASGSAVSLSTNVTSNITSISLTAGDWDVAGEVHFGGGATTNTTFLGGGSSTTSATLGGEGTMFQYSPGVAGFVPFVVATLVYPIPVFRISIASTTIVYLVAQATFTVSTLIAYGAIRARRIR